MPALVLVTPATKEPVSVEEVKRALNLPLDYAEDDALLEQGISAARELGESLTSAAWVESVWELRLPGFPAGAIRDLGRHPVQSVQSVAYLDPDGNLQTLNEGADYEVSIGGRTKICDIWPAYGTRWPETRPGPQSVRIQFTAGWPLDGDGNPTTPQNLKWWLYRMVGAFYEQREALVVGGGGLTVAELPRAHLDGLLDPYTVLRSA